MSYPRSIAILTGPDTYLDHIGVLCTILQIPLIITEVETFNAAKEFYPQLDAHHVEIADLSLSFLAENFDVIFQSGRFWNLELGSVIELLYKKKMRFVFCPHGNSDKGYSFKIHTTQDVSLVYGEHMLSLLEMSKALDYITSTVKTGNYRLPFYLQNKKFYDDAAKKRLQELLYPQKRTILYAPTWHDGENPSSFFSSCKKMISSLNGEYNLIIKLHPFLEHFHPAETYSVLSHYENIKGTIFLNKFPAIYPILSLSDLYVGDFSSIGYDFLAFDRPMFFFNTLEKNAANTPGYFLHQCGIEIPSNVDLKEFLALNLSSCKTDYREKRKEIYNYAFGKEKQSDQLKNEIFESLQDT